MIEERSYCRLVLDAGNATGSCDKYDLETCWQYPKCDCEDSKKHKNCNNIFSVE